MGDMNFVVLLMRIDAMVGEEDYTEGKGSLSNNLFE